MKFCKDCRYMEPGSGPGFERCMSPKNVAGFDPVQGTPKVHWIYCESHRSNGLIWSRIFRSCGKGGQWFEAKEAL